MREDHEDLKDKSDRKMLDLTKPVQTRDGRKVEIISTKGRGYRNIIGYIEDTHFVNTWNEKGKYSDLQNDSEYDLINVPTKKSGWINIASVGLLSTFIFKTEKEARDYANNYIGKIATIFIEWEE